MTEQDLLIEALVAVGVARNHIEAHSRSRPLVGWTGIGDRSADVIIRREHLAHSYGDMGFERSATGYRLHVDDLDSEHGRAWLSRVAKKYESARRARADRLRHEHEERTRRVEAERAARLAAIEEAKRRHEAEMAQLQRQRDTERIRAAELAARREQERLEREQREFEVEQARLAEEHAREEQRRQDLVQAQKTEVIGRAKRLGYTVTESEEGEAIRLVLVKRSF
jgi:hypothetical protein